MDWTEDKVNELLEYRENLGLTIHEISEAMGTSYKSVDTALRRYNIQKGKTQQKSHPISEAAFVKLATDMGFLIERIKDLKGEKIIYVDIKRFEGNEFELGLVADTQLCSKYQQLTYLHDAYSFFETRGINTVFHMGDLVDGWTVYRGHYYEVFLIGNDAQAEYAINNYPKRKGIKTYIVGGQHDYVFWKDRGFDILNHIANEREDLESVGYFGGYVNIGKKKHYLHHPGGGIAYARSYKTQKMIENFPPEKKPHFLFRGHHHVYNQMVYRNVVAIDMPCFQSQTPYLREKGYNPELGFLIIKFKINNIGVENNLACYKTEHYPFFIPKEKDY